MEKKGAIESRRQGKGGNYWGDASLIGGGKSHSGNRLELKNPKKSVNRNHKRPKHLGGESMGGDNQQILKIIREEIGVEHITFRRKPQISSAAKKANYIGKWHIVASKLDREGNKKNSSGDG